MRGQRGRAESHSKHEKLAHSPEPLCPQGGAGPGAGEAWRAEGRAPGVCYRGVSLRKGRRPPPSPTFSGTFKWEGSFQLLCFSGHHHRLGCASYTQIGCYLFFHGPVTCRAVTHTCICTHTLLPSKYLRMNSHTDARGKTHCYQAGHRQSLSPTYSHVVT